MWVLVSYDVNTQTKQGRRRLRKVSKACEGVGQRVQFSVFECQVDEATWAALRSDLLATIDPQADSLRFYYLGENGPDRSEHHGTKPSVDMEGPLIL